MERLSLAIEKSEGRIDALTERMDREKDPDLAANFQADLQDVRANLAEMQTSYQSMLDRFVTAGFAGQVEIVEHAYAVPTPVRPDPVTLTAAGLAAGFLLAVRCLTWAPVDAARRPLKNPSPTGSTTVRSRTCPSTWEARSEPRPCPSIRAASSSYRRRRRL